MSRNFGENGERSTATEAQESIQGKMGDGFLAAWTEASRDEYCSVGSCRGFSTRWVGLTKRNLLEVIGAAWHEHEELQDAAALTNIRYMAGGAIDFSGPQSIASALGVLAGIIAIHECGHFAAARLQGIHVTKFAIGFGPPLLSYQVSTESSTCGTIAYMGPIDC